MASTPEFSRQLGKPDHRVARKGSEDQSGSTYDTDGGGSTFDGLVPDRYQIAAVAWMKYTVPDLGTVVYRCGL